MLIYVIQILYRVVRRQAILKGFTAFLLEILVLPRQREKPSFFWVEADKDGKLRQRKGSYIV